MTEIVSKNTGGFQKDALRLLREAKSDLFSRYPIKYLCLFGSVSRQDDTSTSDVDILVDFTKPVGMEYIYLSYDLQKILKRKVDLVSRKGIKDKYYKMIEADLIYV